MWLLAPTILVLTWIGWSGFSLLRNYKIAKTLDLPIIISPVSSLSVPWIIMWKSMPQVVPALYKLPFGLGRWAKYMYFGWVYDDAGAIHEEFGPAVILCTPTVNELVVRDHEATRAILTRRKDFIKPAVMYDQLNMFGRNVDSVEGVAWQRHRRLTAPSLNENVSSTVWAEALRQTEPMLQKWTKCGDSGMADVSHDTATLALHVWTKGGFGIQYDFNDPAERPRPPHRESYRDAMLAVLRGFTALTILPMSWLEWPIMPASLRRLGQSCTEFKLYMQEMVEREKSSTESRAPGASNLLTSMIRASEQDKKAGSGDTRSLGLSNEELFGNMFIFSLAGHETTANALAAAIVYLAADPQWQGWLAEEIKSVYGSDSDPEDWLYNEKFPKLLRCFACLLETLRLTGSAPHIPKTTAGPNQVLRIGGRDYVLPEDTFIVVNGQALQCDPHTWGDDAMEWRPDRWIKQSPNGTPELITPVEGSYIPWADGPRICPGKKFAQVEFVAVISYLFYGHRVKPAVPGKSLDVSQKLARAMVRDCSIESITLQMRDSTKVPLIWSKAA